MTKPTAAEDQAILAKALLNSEVYGTADTPVEVLETHTAYVFLVGDVAYKIKKAVDFGFLNFLTLTDRHFYCMEELRLNYRLAPALYLDVIPITGTSNEPLLNGAGGVIEWAVKMRRFEQRNRLDHVLADNRLTPQLVDEVARVIADFHARTDRAPPNDDFGSPQSIQDAALENFTQLGAWLTSAEAAHRLQQLRVWTEAQLRNLQAAFSTRKKHGFVRECHGDLHLGNIALVDGSVTLFDCLEFNPGLRWIDTINDIAFVLMDLRHQRHPYLSFRLLNGYLEASGDYDGLKVLDFYCVYRALVRAKVACIRRHQAGVGHTQQLELDAECRSYIELAQQFTSQANPALIITHGFSGSGKTWCTQSLLQTIGAIRVRADVERKRLQGLQASARTRSGLGQGMYSEAMTDRTYHRLNDLGAWIISAGYTAIIDATFLKRSQRDAFRQRARALNVKFIILDFIADETTLRSRIAARLEHENDASEADKAILDHQLATHEPLQDDEMVDVVRCNSEQLSRVTNEQERWQAVTNFLRQASA